MTGVYGENELAHFGKQGMKWGVRTETHRTIEIKRARSSVQAQKQKIYDAKTHAAQAKAVKAFRESPDRKIARQQTAGALVIPRVLALSGATVAVALGVPVNPRAILSGVVMATLVARIPGALSNRRADRFVPQKKGSK